MQPTICDAEHYLSLSLKFLLNNGVVFFPSHTRLVCTVDLNLPFSRLLFLCIGHVSAMPVGVWPTALLWMDDVTVSQMWKDKAVTGALKGCGVRHIRARMISDSQGSQALHSRSTEANRVVSLCTEYSIIFF